LRFAATFSNVYPTDYEPDHLAEHIELAPALADLNDPIASIEAGLDDRPELLESRDQSRSPTVAQQKCG
jgi:hypothetical protein